MKDSWPFSAGKFVFKSAASSIIKSHLQNILTSILYYIHIYELTAEIRMKIEDRRKQGDLPALTDSDKLTNSISGTFLGEKTES